MIAGWRCQGLVRFLVIGGLIWSCVRQEPVAMQCVWVLYGTPSESFLIDTTKPRPQGTGITSLTFSGERYEGDGEERSGRHLSHGIFLNQRDLLCRGDGS